MDHPPHTPLTARSCMLETLPLIALCRPSLYTQKDVTAFP
jgi:hypothetical protein